MSFLFTGTTGDHAGHSLITWAIARRLVEKGLSVGFMKPFGTHPVNMEGLWTDRDVFLFKEVLNLQEPFNRICPYLLSEETWGNKGEPRWGVSLGGDRPGPTGRGNDSWNGGPEG